MSDPRAADGPLTPSLAVAAGRMVLGTWQGLYLFEHRRRPHRRTIALHIIGSGRSPRIEPSS